MIQILNQMAKSQGSLLLETCRSPLDSLSSRKAPIPPRLFYPLEFPDGRIFSPLLSEGDQVLTGTLIARSEGSRPQLIHAASSGTLGFTEGPLPFEGGPKGRMAYIETDGLDLPEPRFPPLPENASPQALTARMHECGIVGLGGGGFPSHLKLQDPQALRVLIINAVECEPYLSCDDRLARENAHELIRTLSRLKEILKIPRTVLALGSDRRAAQNALKKATDPRILPDLEFLITDPRYPSGSERQLVSKATGIELPRDVHPSQEGILVFNLATLWAIGRAIEAGEVLTRRMITVSGPKVPQPQNLWTRIGTPCEVLIHECGGKPQAQGEIWVLGGAMMGFEMTDGAMPVEKTTAALLGLEAFASEKTPEAPCIRCGACHDVCPQALEPYLLHAAQKSNRKDRLAALGLLECIECGACDVICPSHIPLTRTFHDEKPGSMQLIEEQLQSQQARSRYEARKIRLEKEEIERQMEMKRRKEALTKSSEPKILEALERARKRKVERQPDADKVPPS